MKSTEENRLEHIIKRMENDRSEDAPADSVRYIKNLFRTRVAARNTSAIQRVLAVMRADLAPNRAVFGERSAGVQQMRQMLFEAGANSIDLRLEKSGRKFQVSGQILGEGFAAAQIEISKADAIYSAETNEMSEFKIKDVGKGAYSFTVLGTNQSIVIEYLEID